MNKRRKNVKEKFIRYKFNENLKDQTKRGSLRMELKIVEFIIKSLELYEERMDNKLIELIKIF